MSLPLPRVVADVGPGGPLVTAMGGMNSLANNMLLRKINAVKAQYAPLTTQAEAASKLAYANLMGPQFLAKIMGNDSALANMSEDQKKAALQKIYQAGSGQGTGLNAFNQMHGAGQGLPTGVGQPSTNSLSGWFANTLKNAFGHNQLGQGQNTFASPAQQQPMPQQQTPQQIPQSGEPQVGDAVYGEGGNPEFEQAFAEWLQSPEGKSEVAKGEAANIPDEKEVIEWKRNKDGNVNAMEMTLTKPASQKTYAEKTGNYKGIVQEGSEMGKIRAKDIENLNNSVFNAETNQATLDEVSDILASPTFEKIRQVPLAGHHELSYYAREGTPEEQQMVGKYYTLTGNLIKDASRDFAGQFRKGEQQLLNGMKPGPSDTVDSAKGKTETLSVLNKMLAARSRLTSKIMAQNHVNKLEAMEEADRQVNGSQIRREVHDRLNPTVTIRNRKTGEEKTISAAEARKLGVPNV
jgi:hypothetical protein